MTNFWCVNFDFDGCLKHGLANKLWMMQYQYALDENNVFQGDRKNSVSANWRRTKDIEVGDWFVAYLPKDKSSTGNTYFAVGQVRRPRKASKPRSNISKVEAYIAKKSSHEIASGVVHYSDAPVFYEDFDDDWSDVDFPAMKYAQRVDVESWLHVVPEGVPWLSSLKIGPNEIQRAFFKIPEKQFNQIKKELESATKTPKKRPKKYTASAREQRAAADASEKAYAKGQGYQLDSELRKALEDYAMDAAKKHFRSLGYKVEDHARNHPYDLKCSKADQTVYVEVKGTQSAGESVILTAGEVNFGHKHSEQMALYLFHSIVVASDGKSLSGGQPYLLMPWELDKTDLAPLSFKYQVP